MRVTTTFRAPDEGEDVILLTCDADGNVGHLGRLRRYDLAALLPALEEAQAHEEEHGGPSIDVALARDGTARWLRRLVTAGELPDPERPHDAPTKA